MFIRVVLFVLLNPIVKSTKQTIHLVDWAGHQKCIRYESTNNTAYFQGVFPHPPTESGALCCCRATAVHWYCLMALLCIPCHDPVDTVSLQRIPTPAHHDGSQEHITISTAVVYLTIRSQVLIWNLHKYGKYSVTYYSNVSIQRLKIIIENY